MKELKSMSIRYRRVTGNDLLGLKHLSAKAILHYKLLVLLNQIIDHPRFDVKPDHEYEISLRVEEFGEEL